MCVSELDIDIISDALLFTFSIANSSSALVLISRAFSWASCLMNATWIFECEKIQGFISQSLAYHIFMVRHTILFISLITSSSFNAREDMIYVVCRCQLGSLKRS